MINLKLQKCVIFKHKHKCSEIAKLNFLFLCPFERHVCDSWGQKCCFVFQHLNFRLSVQGFLRHLCLHMTKQSICKRFIDGVALQKCILWLANRMKCAIESFAPTVFSTSAMIKIQSMHSTLIFELLQRVFFFHTSILTGSCFWESLCVCANCVAELCSNWARTFCNEKMTLDHFLTNPVHFLFWQFKAWNA